ncbi:unnamed protein product [Arctogadus glacialis]
MLDRLAALGYFPLLLLGKKNKRSYTAQVFGSMQMQLDPSLQEDLQSVYVKILKLHFKRFPQPTENGTQSGDGVGMEGEQGIVPEEGADIEFVVLDIILYEDGNYDVVGQDDQGTQSVDGVGMGREQGMVPEEGAGTQSSDVVGMEREQKGRKENKDEKMVKSRRKRKYQTGTQSVDGVGMEGEQGMVPEEGAGTQSSDVVGMEREQEGRKENKDEKMVEGVKIVLTEPLLGPIFIPKLLKGQKTRFFFSGFPARNGDWGAFIKFLTQPMLEMGLKECVQVMHQAGNSGHTSCVLIHRAVLGRPDFNWAQIMSGTHTRQLRPADPQFEDFTHEWFQNKMAEAPLDLSQEDYARLDTNTRAEALRQNADQLRKNVTVSNKLLTTLKSELTVWRSAMASLKDNPYQVFSQDHTGVAPQMRNLAYLCWKLCTDVMGDHFLTSYAGFKAGGIVYMRGIDTVISEYKSRLTDETEMDVMQTTSANLSTVYESEEVAAHFAKTLSTKNTRLQCLCVMPNVPVAVRHSQAFILTLY